MKFRHNFLANTLIATSVLVVTAHAIAAGNPKKGADVFAEECGDCHSAKEGKSKKGPPLHGVVGRKAGSVGDFAGYSEPMKQSGIVWTEERIDAYIAAPKKVVPGGKMKYDGLPDAASRADVIAYVMSLK
jgi:cytochrome c